MLMRNIRTGIVCNMRCRMANKEGIVERCWKIIGSRRQALVSGTKFTYPKDGVWAEHTGNIGLCKRGYHYCEGRQVLDWLESGLLAEVEPCPEHKPKKGDNKNVTCQLRVVRTFPLTARVLRLFAADCAERALQRERDRGREPDARSWEAVRVARAFAYGKATKAELAAAGYAAGAAAGYAAGAAAGYAAGAAAGYAARYAARYAAGYAARDAEQEWQYHRLLQLVKAEEG